jgi:hypothetical protein
VAGGAQAADLSIAEPVEYVRVCDAFGPGYWYIPGGDTCIKIGGAVEFYAKYDSVGFNYSSHSSHWKFVTEANVNFMASSMTEYGRLDGYVKMKGVYDPTNSDKVFLDEAWLSLGHLTLGHLGSVSNTKGGYSDGAYQTDKSTNQIRLSFAAGGFGIMLGIEDPRERWGTSLTDGDEFYSMPDITGKITASMGHLSAELYGAWGEIEDEAGDPNGTGVYGVGGTLEAALDAVSPGSKVIVGGSFGTGSSFVGTSPIFVDFQNNWQAFASAVWQLTSTTSLAGTYAYSATDGGSHATRGGAKLVWAPVAGFSAYVHGTAQSINDAPHTWEVRVGAVRSW